jgi:hypothetical protein
MEVIRQAGFVRVEVVTERRIPVPLELLEENLTGEQLAEAERNDLHVMSVTVKAFKP